jgi:NAD(P)-dependent dehydrogenase (short-subunit alcohol dehydrogenase family)
VLDLRSEAKTRNEMRSILKTHGSVRALVNNAGTWMGTTSIEHLSLARVKESIDLNFYTAFNATTSLLKANAKNENLDLAVINIGATASTDAWVDVLPFCLGKGALRSFSRALARELGPKGVHVAHCIVDGMLDNERTRKLNPKTRSHRFIRQTALAEDVIRIALQDRSCWTAEWDARPYSENW